MRPRGARPILVAAVMGVMLLAGRPAPLLAHASLVRSSPAEGAHLGASPARVSLVFSEPLEPGLARVVLAGPGSATRALDVAADPHDVHALVASINGSLAAGAYAIRYRVVSADGHPVQGEVRFTIGEVSGAAPPAIPERDEQADASAAAWGPSVAGAPIVPALLRGLALAALLAFAGLAWFTVTNRAGGVAARAMTWLSVAAPLLLVAHLAAWVANVAPDHALGGEAVSAALGSGVGRVELLRTLLALLAAWALLLARRQRLALGFALAAVLVSGATGHAAALHPLWAVPAKALHLAGVALWLGGVLWLAGCLARGDVDHRAAAERVSSVALAAAIVVTLTGVVQALLFMATPMDVVRSAYGAVVLAKVAGLAVLLGYGAHHRWRALPRLARGDVAPLRTTLRQELGVMLVVVLLGGLLAYIPPDAPGAARAGASHSIPS